VCTRVPLLVIEEMTNEELRKRIESFDLPRDKAIPLLQRALECEPDFQLAHREPGWAFCTKDDIENAEYHIIRAIDLNPTDGWAYIYLGNVRWRQFDYDAAEAAFQQAISVWPKGSIPLWCLAIFYAGTRVPERAADGRTGRAGADCPPRRLWWLKRRDGRGGQRVHECDREA
jgi:tetratricopeptide (TPR) repeat protein